MLKKVLKFLDENKLKSLEAAFEDAKKIRPTNLEECFSALDKLIAPKEIENIKNSTDEKYMVGFHMGLGMWMRNNWGLWHGSKLKDYFMDLGIDHADDMSGIILDSYWRHLHNQPLNIEDQVKYYQEYWARQKTEYND